MTIAKHPVRFICLSEDKIGGVEGCTPRSTPQTIRDSGFSAWDVSKDDSALDSLRKAEVDGQDETLHHVFQNLSKCFILVTRDESLCPKNWRISYFPANSRTNATMVSRYLIKWWLPSVQRLRASTGGITEPSELHEPGTPSATWPP